MIRQTTTIPLVEPPDVDERRSGAGRMMFIALEVVLLGAIPVLGLLGFRSLLGSRSGEFLVDPGPDDAGWVASVEPTPLSILVDVDGGRVGGAVLIVPSGDDADGGAVILISGATEVAGIALSERTPAGVVDAIEETLKLEIGEPAIANAAGWETLLGGQPIELANPDPVVDLGASNDAESGDAESGEATILVPAGRVTVAAGDLAALSTRSPVGSSDPEALEFRREVLWQTLLADAAFDVGESDDEVLLEAARRLRSIVAGVHRVDALPLDGTVVDLDGAEELIRSVVALPRGHEVGARLQVRIVDRSGGNDLEAAARNLGAAGFEVVQISNAMAFDDGPTQVLAPPGGAVGDVARLAEVADAATVPASLDAEATSVVTLLIGPEASIARPAE